MAKYGKYISNPSEISNEFTPAMFEYYKTNNAFYDKAQEKGFKQLIKWNYSKPALKKFLIEVFAGKMSLRFADFDSKASDLFYDKYKVALNTGDFNNLVDSSGLTYRMREAPPHVIVLGGWAF
jgi:hypothetical protein